MFGKVEMVADNIWPNRWFHVTTLENPASITTRSSTQLHFHQGNYDGRGNHF